MRLPRLRAITPYEGDTENRHFGVQARTLQALAMTGWEKSLGF